jgi:hypothetical protein
MHEKGEPCTTKYIADTMHVDEHRISVNITKWVKGDKDYIIRLKEKTVQPSGRWYYQYILSESGKEVYKKLSDRAKRGENISKSVPIKNEEQIPIGINSFGKMMGLTQYDAFEKAGLLNHQ